MMKETYIRVECIDNVTGESRGGYVCAIIMMFALMLGVSPNIDRDELSGMLDTTQDPEVQDLLLAFVDLGDIPKPDVYEADKMNRVCLYTESEFYEAVYDLADVAEMLLDKMGCRYSLLYKQCVIEEEAILYEDPYQIVISRETYDSIKEDFPYQDIISLRDEMDGDIEDPDLD